MNENEVLSIISEGFFFLITISFDFKNDHLVIKNPKPNRVSQILLSVSNRIVIHMLFKN